MVKNCAPRLMPDIKPCPRLSDDSVCEEKHSEGILDLENSNMCGTMQSAENKLKLSNLTPITDQLG